MQPTIKDYWSLKNEIDKNLPWLILGKGPSLNQYDPNIHNYSYNILALNHVGRYVNADICIYHDNEVEHISIANRCKYILKPYHPHIKFKPYSLANTPLWNNIYYFNLSTWKGKRKSDSPVIKARYNVAESAFHILALFGIKEIRTLGVDGGKEYSKIFSYLKPLTNGQPNFDKQFVEINKICKKFGINYSPL